MEDVLGVLHEERPKVGVVIDVVGQWVARTSDNESTFLGRCTRIDNRPDENSFGYSPPIAINDLSIDAEDPRALWYFDVAATDIEGKLPDRIHDGSV